MSRDFRYTSVQDALATLSNALDARPRGELVSVREAFRRVLASKVISREDFPRRDVSHFDGFAISSHDTLAVTADRPAILALSPGATRVGLPPKRNLAPGRAMRISTGGYLPAGADAVVALEDSVIRENEIEVARRVPPGERVYPRGSDVKKGDLLLPAGRTLLAQDLVLLASMHIENVPVFARPKVAVVPTGSELTTDVGDRKSGKVVESHGLLLKHLIEEAGGASVLWPIIPDEKPAIARALRQALKRCDLVFSLAGTSLGEPDLVEEAVRSIRARRKTILVHGIKVHRGRVMGFAVVDGKAIVLLPGPIQAALNAFIVFGYPLIRRYLGNGFEHPPDVPATVEADWEAVGRYKGFDQIVYLHLRQDPSGEKGLLAVPASAETEKVSFLVSKNAYTIVPGDKSRLQRGERIRAFLLPGFSGLEQ